MSRLVNLSFAKKYAVNGFYFVLIFLLAFGIATQALVRKINTYNLTNSVLFLTVDKDDVEIGSTLAGRVGEVLVQSGDHVDEGEVIMRLVDPSLEPKIEALEGVARENLSARTELELIRARSGEYEIRAPRSGVVYQVKVVKGTFVQPGAVVALLFANENVRLVGAIKPEQYPLIEKSRGINVFNPRLGQVYTALFHGVGRVKESDLASSNDVTSQTTNDTPRQETYEILFRLQNDSEGASFLEGERLEILPEDNEEERLKPVYRMVDIWNSLIVGTDPETLLRRYETQ